MRSVVLACVAFGLPACTTVKGSADAAPTVEVGWYGTFTGGEPSPINVPSTATAGTLFTVSFSTTGSGCGAAVSTDVTPTSDGALVVPYDRYGEPCTIDNEGAYNHSSDLTFAAPGTYTVTFRFRSCYTPPKCASPLVDHAFSIVVQ